MRETFLKRNRQYKGKAVDFHIDQIRLPNGRKAIREYLSHPGAVAALPFIDPETIVMVRQFRYPINKVTYEIPAGKLSKGEKPLNCLKRELAEETGYSARRIKHLVSYWPTPAFSNEIIHIYTASQLTQGKPHPDEDEFISTKHVKISQALKWIRDGQIKDSKTMIALFAWKTFSKS